MKKERLHWIDNMRGLAVVLVMLDHAPHTNIVELTLFSMFMIPSFFMISGYLTKYDGGDLFSYFYNRILKLFIVYAAYVFIYPFLSVSETIKVIHNPSLIIEKLISSCKNLILGKPMWFIACLIVVNIIFMVVRKITRNNYVLMIASIVIAGLGIVTSYVLGEGRRPWSVDTALVCQLFFTLGYILKDIERPEWYEQAIIKATFTGMFYVITMLVCGYFFDFSKVAINVATGNWGKIWITIPMVLLCLYSGLCSSRLFSNLKIFPFFGQTSLIYFAVGNHGVSVMNKLVGIMYNKYGFAILGNRAIINPIIALLGGIILMPLVWLVNKYAPFFNARYKMPAIKNKF